MNIAIYSICTLQFLSVRRAFALAKQNGIEYIEVFPFTLPGRTTTLEQLVSWEKHYGVKVCAIDTPFNYHMPLRKIMAQEHDRIEWAYAAAWHPLFGQGDRNLELARELRVYHQEQSLPYSVVHPDYLTQMGSDFRGWHSKVTFAVENERPKKGWGEILWNPYRISETYRPWGCKLVLDRRHIGFANRLIGAGLDPIQVFLDLRPEMLHFNVGEYLGYGAPAGEELQSWLRAFEQHQPEFLVVEIGPTLRPGKRLEELLKELRSLLPKTKETSGREPRLEAA